MYDHLPSKEKLTRGANTFKCELCDNLIGEQPNKSGSVKPESITEYYRIKLENKGIYKFIFVCPKCAEGH